MCILIKTIQLSVLVLFLCKGNILSHRQLPPQVCFFFSIFHNWRESHYLYCSLPQKSINRKPYHLWYIFNIYFHTLCYEHLSKWNLGSSMYITIVWIYLLGTNRETTTYTFLKTEGISRGKNILLSNSRIIKKKYINLKLLWFENVRFEC